MSRGALQGYWPRVQVHGALGLSDDLPLEAMYRMARIMRIVDGPCRLEQFKNGVVGLNFGVSYFPPAIQEEAYANACIGRFTRGPAALGWAYAAIRALIPRMHVSAQLIK